MTSPRTISRRGMTLMEILVVLGIFGLLAAMTLAMFNPFARGRRAREAARIMQAALVQARSLAVRESDYRGLLFDTRDNRTMYMTQPADWLEMIAKYDANTDGDLQSTEWPDYGNTDAPLFKNLFDDLDGDSDGTLTKAEFDAAQARGEALYWPIDNAAPITLPEGTEFDFSALGSKVRTQSTDTAGADLTVGQQNRWLVFNANGTAEGPGQVLIYLRETSEVSDRIAVVVFCRTGLIEVYEVDPSNPVFSFVNSGATAGE